MNFIAIMMIFFQFNTGIVEEPRNLLEGLQPENEIILLPGVEIDHREFDFGIVYQGQERTHDFTVTNRTDNTITITDIKTDCGIEAAIVGAPKINPGENRAIRITYKPERREGEFTKKVIVFSDLSAKRNWFELKIHAVVDTYLKSFPANIYFTKVFYGESQNESVMIKSYSSEQMDIIEFKHSNENLVVNLEPLSLESLKKDSESKVRNDNGDKDVTKQWKLSVTLKENTPPGRFDDQIRLVTNNSQQSEFIVDVLGVVRTPVKIWPTQCYFGALKAGETVTKTLELGIGKDLEFSNLEIAVDISDLITWKVDAVKEGKKYKIEINCSVPDNYTGKITGELEIKTGVEIHPVVNVPIFGYVPQIKTIQDNEEPEPQNE